ncbi:hypothetical protein ACFQE5_18605 [Pseudonocardia hispaniensis]|uniref:DUF4386 family protein n=1 Tax=Pseudonocardia hispaniensis TaxID=904933 RepID=A0ABW1J6V4_9PSEU
MTATDSTASLSRPATTTPPIAAGGGWAWAGALGGLLGVAGLMVTGNLYDVETGVVADNAALAAAIAERAPLVWAQQALCAVVATCLVVFAAGLRRHLAAQEPAGSLVPQVAATGVGLTAVALLVGGGISTELYWALTGPQPFDPDTIGAHVAIYNTMAWLWGGLALSAGAVALGGLRRGSVGRLLALFSALMAVLLAATQVLPVQYIAVVPGALWLIGMGAAMARRTTHS